MAEKYPEEEEENPGTEQEQHSEYLRIIDDLSSELNTLSCQVNMVQRDFLTDEVAKQFESSLKGLEAQNDLLQSTVERLIEERETIERTLKAQNEELKRSLCVQEAELTDLQNQLCLVQQRACLVCGNRPAAVDSGQRRREDKRTDCEEDLQKLEHELRRRSETVQNLKSENVRLSEELSETRRSQAKLKLLQRRGVVSASAGEKTSEDQQLLCRLAAADKSLQRARKEVSFLQQVVEELRLGEEASKKERELLQIELIALKESQATQMGKQKSLQDQLQGTIHELYAAKEKLKEIVQLKDRDDSLHREEVKRFQEMKTSMFHRYNSLVEEYNRFHEEYEKVVQIEQEKSKQIKAFNAWKTEQLQKERHIWRKLQMYENHIKEMLENKQNLLDKLNETEADNRTLLQVIERTRCQKGNLSASSPGGCYSASAGPSSDPVSKIIQNVRCASRKLLQQRCVLQDEASRFLSQSQ